MNKAQPTSMTGLSPAAELWPAALEDYVALLKPRVMSLVMFTALIGLIAAPGAIHPVLAFAALFFTAMGAGAAGALNMWFDADMDAQMARTRGRPIPAGRLRRGDALTFGLWLAAGAVAGMGLVINLAAATVLATTIAFYVLVYTMWLKRRTAQNIVIGGAAGAFPPMIGWAAATGTVTVESLALFAIIFFWTPPHFWSLALFCAHDYEAAGVPMLPVTAGAGATRRQIFGYSLVLAPIGVSPFLLGMAGPVYGLVSIALGLVLIGRAWQTLTDSGVVQARRLFGFSIVYLFALFATLGLEVTARGLL